MQEGQNSLRYHSEHDLVEQLLDDGIQRKISDVYQALGLPLNAFLSIELSKKADLKDKAKAYFNEFKERLFKYKLSTERKMQGEEFNAVIQHFEGLLEHLEKNMKEVDERGEIMQLVSAEDQYLVENHFYNVVVMTVHSSIGQIAQITQGEFLKLCGEDKVSLILPN